MSNDTGQDYLPAAWAVGDLEGGTGTGLSYEELMACLGDVEVIQVNIDPGEPSGDRAVMGLYVDGKYCGEVTRLKLKPWDKDRSFVVGGFDEARDDLIDAQVEQIRRSYAQLSLAAGMAQVTISALGRKMMAADLHVKPEQDDHKRSLKRSLLGPRKARWS